MCVYVYIYIYIYIYTYVSIYIYIYIFVVFITVPRRPYAGVQGDARIKKLGRPRGPPPAARSVSGGEMLNRLLLLERLPGISLVVIVITIIVIIVILLHMHTYIYIHMLNA